MAATRLSITIPDELAERLEPHRDRMNISKVCAGAIERELSTLANLPAEVKEFTEAIARLRAEKAKAEEDDVLIGLGWGTNWAKDQASYPELKAYASREDLLTWAELPADVKIDFAEMQEYHAAEGAVLNPEKFAEGWIMGVWDFWAIVKDKV